MLFKKINNCRLCKSNKLLSAYKFEDTPIEDDYTKKKNKNILIPLEIMSCISCGFKQLSVLVDEKKVYGDFVYATSTSLGLKEHFRDNFKLAMKFSDTLKKNDLIVDFGSSGGENLEIFKNNGFNNLLGIEPAKDLALSTKKKNIDVIADFFSRNVARNIKKRGNAKIICIYNLLANIGDLDNFFNNVDIFTDKNTTIIFESFSLLGIVKKNLFDNIYHEHISYFHIRPLQKYLKKFNWEIMYAEHNNIKGGSIKLVLARKKKNFDKKSIRKCIKEENKYKLMEHNIFNKIKKKNQNVKERINNVLEKFSSKKIAGYGASCGSTVFLYHYGLTKKFNLLLDDEKRRNKLYAPRTNIRVYNPTINLLNKIDVIVIISWRYGKNIFEKFKKKFKKKIKKKIIWIQVLPRIKIFK